MNKNRSILGFVTFALGLIFGGLATLLFSTDESGKTKKSVQKGVARAKQTLLEATDKERVREIFGKASSKANELYVEARGNILTRVEKLRDQFEKIDKEKYSSVVSDVVNEFKKDGAMTAVQLKKLRTYFLEDYQKVVGKADKKRTSKKA